ncbi:sensor histidine kinase [Fictibacillus barbaricus]|nr:HAMP domain-containing sensor histidine kinase [Fictibacillus barbaricus]
MNHKKRTTLLKYWTTRYLITLIAGLLILAAGSLWWIRNTTLDNRLNIMEYLAVETADRISHSDRNSDFGLFNRRLEERASVLQMEKQPELFITDLKGRVLNGRPPRKQPGFDGLPLQDIRRIPKKLLNNDSTVQKLDVNDTLVYAVKKPVYYENNQAGWVVVMQEASDLTNINQEYRLLIILLLGLGLLGWAVIYLLSKKIVKPIQDVAHAASQIKEGNYEVQLHTDAKEQELYDLLSSFKEMTIRLTQLEKLRAELLAGVTHDLKTPVTSISGLIQAVRDGIVTGEERNEFLDISLKEVHRLQTMIEDLLNFNSLSAGAFTIRNEKCNMNKLVEDIAHQWKVTLNEDIEWHVQLPNKPIFRETDPLRLQQILINLLNNSYHALSEHRSITVSLTEHSIDVKDTGSGIPDKEQPYVFERFFRGEKKKLKVRGLGLGLPFSKMLAKAMNADLILKKSSPQGTTFSIFWESHSSK